MAPVSPSSPAIRLSPKSQANCALRGSQLWKQATADNGAEDSSASGCLAATALLRWTPVLLKRQPVFSRVRADSRPVLVECSISQLQCWQLHCSCQQG